jgi:hypothetical protein
LIDFYELPSGLAAAIAPAGVDSQLEERALQDALISAIVDRHAPIV